MCPHTIILLPLTVTRQSIPYQCLCALECFYGTRNRENVEATTRSKLILMLTDVRSTVWLNYSSDSLGLLASTVVLWYLKLTDSG